MFILALTTQALAQQPADWVYQSGSVLDPTAVVLNGIPVTSIGNPSVVYDSIRGRWFMLFEAKLSTTDARCPQGLWAVGAAVSPDGVTWTPYTNAILKPATGLGKFYGCVVSHPTAVFQPALYAGNGGLVVMFKAEQENDACAVVTPSWGCAVATGLGRLQVELLPNGDPKKISLTQKPVHTPSTPTFGYPKMIQDKNNRYRVLYQAYPDIVSTTTTNLASWPAAVTEITKASGAVDWAVNEVFNPSFVCNDDLVGTNDYAVFVGGRDTNGATVVEGSWGKAISAVATGAWVVDLTPQVSWTGNDTWRHWDVTRLASDEYLVWFDEKDGSGNNFIRFGGTTLAFANSDAVSKVCP